MTSDARRLKEFLDNWHRNLIGMRGVSPEQIDYYMKGLLDQLRGLWLEREFPSDVTKRLRVWDEYISESS